MHLTEVVDGEHRDVDASADRGRHSQRRGAGALRNNGAYRLALSLTYRYAWDITPAGIYLTEPRAEEFPQHRTGLADRRPVFTAGQ